MDIRFRCPACNRKLSVDGSRAGEQVPCPLCNEKIRIPAEDVNARVKELESENRKLRFKMEAAQKEAESLMATEMALWKAEASIKETSGLETKLAEAKQKLADLSSERNTLRGNLSGLEKTAKECKDLKAKITALTAERDKISAARDKLKEDVDARPTQARLDAVTTERDDFRESGARLQAALDQKETRIADLERQTAEQKNANPSARRNSSPSAPISKPPKSPPANPPPPRFPKPKTSGPKTTGTSRPSPN